jgi:hypothetical protein
MDKFSATAADSLKRHSCIKIACMVISAFALYLILVNDAEAYSSFNSNSVCSLHQNATQADYEMLQFITQLSLKPRYTFDEKQRALLVIEDQFRDWNMLNGDFKRLTYSGYQVTTRVSQTISYGFQAYNGTNYWAVVREANMTKYEAPEIILLTAHYDSVRNSPATFDNAAGVGVGMLTAKLLASRAAAYSKFTIWLLLTDYEEDLYTSAAGSGHFVMNLPPSIRSRVKYVINIDSIGAWSTEEQTQKLPPKFPFLFPEASMRIKNNNYRGNFVAAIAAGSRSVSITKAIIGVAERCAIGKTLSLFPAEQTDSLLNILPLSLPLIGGSLVCGTVGMMLGTSDLCRSDHQQFWLDGIPAVHLTDTANFRTSCYHRPCDNSTQLEKPGVIRRLVQLTEILASTIELLIQ